MKTSIFRRAVAVCGLLAGTIIPAAAGEIASNSNRSGSTLRQARQLVQSGQSRAAEELLLGILEEKRAEPNAAQLAGSLELLTTIYRESGRYVDALRIGKRYQELLERNKNVEPSLVAKRQEIAVTLGEIYSALLRYPEAADSFDKALSLPDGLRQGDPLWELRVCAMQARTAQSRGNKSAAQAYWRELESKAKELVAKFERRAVDHATCLAAVKLLSQSLLATNRPQEAVAALEKLRSLETADERASARTLGEIANCYSQMHEPAKEKQALLDALALAQRNDKQKPSAEAADLLDRLGTVCQIQRDEAQAQQYWTQAAQAFEALVERAGDDPAEQMQHCQDLQRVYQRLGRWQDGIRVTERLLEYREKTMLADDPDIWRAKSALAGFYCKLDDTAAARPLLEEALVFWRGRTPPPITELAGTLNNLAEVARSSGAYNEAFEHLEEALPLYEQLYAADDFRLAELHSNLAAVLSAKGRYKAAIDHYRAAATICRQATGNDHRQAEELLATTLLNTAMLYKSQRQFGEAASNCLEALDIRRRLAPGDEKSLLPFYLAIASLHLAQDQSQHSTDGALSNDLLEAEKFTAEARGSCERLRQLEKPNGGTVHQLEGMIQLRHAKLDLAQHSFQESLKIAKSMRQMAAEAKSLTYLAEVELRSGLGAAATDERASAFTRAEQLSREALDLHRQVQAYPNLQFMAFLSYARAARALGHVDTAKRSLDLAVRLIESPRAATVGAESERAEFFSQFVMAFDLLVDWNVADDRLADALTAAEMGRNRTFVDQLRAAGIDLRESLAGGPHEDLLRREREVLAGYTQLLAEVRKAYAAAAPREQIAKSAARIDELRQEYSRIQRDIRDASPAYRNLLGEHREARSWSEIAPQVLAPDNVLLLYYLGHTKSYLFLVDGRSGAIEHVSLDIPAEAAAELGLKSGPLSRSVAAELVNEYLAVLRSAGPVGKRGLSPDVVISGKGASDTPADEIVPLAASQQVAVSAIFLPQSVRERIARLDPAYVVVVPDGALDQLPLEALLLDDAPARYLLDDFPPITYAPSATIQSLLSQRRHTSAEERLSLLTVGDPRYPDLHGKRSMPGAAAIAEYQAFGGHLDPLPATLDECRQVKQAIAACGPSADVVMLVGPEATEKNVHRYIGNRRFVHFAAHGLVDERHENLFGAIALTPPPAGSPPTDGDGFMSLYEIHNLSLTDCELVVLSACETNVGSNRPLEAGSTLARAFLAAGARGVVSSHWSVEDASTARLISEFFQQFSADLKQGRKARYANALHDARRTIRNQSAWAAPHYWAPFVLIGPASGTDTLSRQFSTPVIDAEIPNRDSR